MSSFSRKVERDLLDSLKNSDLYQKKLLPDLTIVSKNQLRVFPAFRQQVVDFYYGGGRAYRFDSNGFTTHLKYGAVAVKGPRGDYFRESDLSNGAVKWPVSFIAAHQRIKENSRLFSGVEAEGVSRLYSKHSYVVRAEEYVVLDIEIAFSNNGDLEDDLGRPSKLQNQKKTNRVDLLLYSLAERRLLFVEAKHHTNPEIRAKKTPKVIGQLDRYNEILSQQDMRQSILEQYWLYIDQANQLFDLSLPKPETIADQVKLLIFGMDRQQLNEFRGAYEEAYTGYPVYHFQKPGSIVLKNLWNEVLWTKLPV